jgi:hypothetical protein
MDGARPQLLGWGISANGRPPTRFARASARPIGPQRSERMRTEQGRKRATDPRWRFPWTGLLGDVVLGAF